MYDSLWPHGSYTHRLLCLWDFPGKNTGVDCHFLLQGIFLTQGSNLSLLHWQADSLQLSHFGGPTRHYRDFQKCKTMSLFSLFFNFWKCNLKIHFTSFEKYVYEIKITNETQPSLPTWITITSRNHHSRRKYILNKTIVGFCHLFPRDRHNWNENMRLPGKCNCLG